MLLLDASALLAVLQGERGAEMVTMAMDDGSMSAANLSEVAAKLVQHGVPYEEAVSILKSFDLKIIPVDENVALVAGSLYAMTKSAGLSLGDRLCLATAILEKLEVLTADNAWAAIKVDGLNVRYIR